MLPNIDTLIPPQIGKQPNLNNVTDGRRSYCMDPSSRGQSTKVGNIPCS